MIELLRALILLLTQDALSADDVVARIGSVASDPGVPMPIKIHPRQGLRSASLARYADTATPYLLCLEPEVAWRPTVAELTRAFGDSRRARNDRGRPVELLFYPPSPAPKWSVVLIAELVTDGHEPEEATVANLTLRRDPPQAVETGRGTT